jgi:GTP-binding protein
MDANFIISACNFNQFPDHTHSEIVFMGKSNSGKSTLINALVNHKNLARQSSTPGSTRMINFYQLKLTNESPTFILADLPGYGFQKNSQTLASSWDKIITEYFERSQIKLLLFLKDIRRNMDADEWKYLRYIYHVKKIKIHVVLTKTDKLSNKDTKVQYNKLKEQLIIHKINVDLFNTSCLKKKGIENLRTNVFI